MVISDRASCRAQNSCRISQEHLSGFISQCPCCMAWIHVQVHRKWLMKVFKFQLATWQWKSNMWIQEFSAACKEEKGSTPCGLNKEEQKARGRCVLTSGHLVCVAASHPCTAFPLGWGDLRLFSTVAVVCHRFKWQYFWVLGFVLLLVSQIVCIIIISEQVGSTKVQFIILRRESIIFRHSQSPGGPDFQWRAQSSCKSNYTWAVLHTEILEKSLSITSHFIPIAPQTCLTVSSPEAAGPLHPSGDGHAVHVHVVFLEMAHPGQKQTSGHTGWCDGLGKERKHLGLSFSIFSTKHSLRPICWSKSTQKPINTN